MADATVRRYIKKRGYRRPEDRLRAAFWALAVIIPFSSIAYGWLVQFAKGGIAPPLIITVINGIGVMLVFTPVNTYAVDVMQKRGAEVIAVNNCRSPKFHLSSADEYRRTLPLLRGIVGFRLADGRRHRVGSDRDDMRHPHGASAPGLRS